MKIIADTNVLVRAAIQDDPAQARAAKKILKEADKVVVSRHALCEFVWVLARAYKLSKAQIEAAIRTLIATEKVIVDSAAVTAGLRTLTAGADFADGVIAHEGAWLGGETFVSFDKKAVAAVDAQGQRAKLLS